MTIRLLAIFLFLCGCSTGTKAPVGDVDSTERSADLESALKDLEDENYTSASIALEKLAKKDPASEMDLVILYNLAVSREGLKQCEEASEIYRSVARISNKKFERIEALALYRLGFVYECLGQPQKSVVAFLDARKRRTHLPQDISEAELPARLAAGYASLGRQKEALGFFNEASGGLKRLLARSKGKKNREFVARTLVAMGKISETSEPLVFLKMLGMQQPFLLQATELGEGSSSRKASKELMMAYSKIDETISRANSPEARVYLIEALRVTRELKRLKLPDSEKYTRDVFLKVDKVEQNLVKRLAALSSGLPKTPEALKRESLKKSP